MKFELTSAEKPKYIIIPTINGTSTTTSDACYLRIRIRGSKWIHFENTPSIPPRSSAHAAT